MNPRSAWQRLTASERRAITRSAALVALAVLLFRGLPFAVGRYATLAARAELTEGALARAHDALDAAPAVRDSVSARARRLVALAPRLLAGNSPAESSAELAALVGSTAAIRHVRITEQETRPDSQASLFTRVSLRVSAESDAGGLASWIADLEEGEKLIRVRALALTAPDPNAPPSQAERLRADVIVDGWATRRTAR